MPESCSIIPKVKNKKGEVVESKLFKDLLSFANNVRKTANDIYLRTKSDKFITHILPKLKVDDNNEPLISELFKKAGLDKFIDIKAILEKLNRDIGFYKKGQERPAFYRNNNKNAEMLKQKAIKFNKENEFREDYVAHVVRVTNPEDTHHDYINVKVERKTPEYSLEAKKMEYNEALNKRIRELMHRLGVADTVIDAAMEKMGINGVTDFEGAERLANGMIAMIKLAKGEKGEAALPEEFAHLALDMLGDNPLVSRLINLIISKDLAREILGDSYEDYVIAYTGDKLRLAREAAGKLVARGFLNNYSDKNAPVESNNTEGGTDINYKEVNTIENKPYTSLLKRVIQAIKNFLNKFKVSDFEKAKIEADSTANQIAKDILTGALESSMSFDNLKFKDKLFNLAERNDKLKKTAEKLIENELKRLHIYQKRSERFKESQTELIAKMQAALDEHRVVESIILFNESALKHLQQLQTRFDKLKDPAATLQEKAKILINIHNYLSSYNPMLQIVRESVLDEESFADNLFGSRIRPLLTQTSELLRDLKSFYDKNAVPLFIEFIKPYVGEGIVVPFGKWKGKVITAKTLVTEADKDISFVSRWLDSMAETPDMMLRTIGSIVSQTKEKARLDTLDYKKRIEALGVALKEAGIDSTEFMFEVDKDGHKTGRYITEIDWQRYNSDKEEFFAHLDDKYGTTPVGVEEREKQREKRQWFAENLNNGIPVAKYQNEAFTKLNEAQKEFYRGIMAIKAELDAMLPEHYTRLTNAVKIRKDLIERLKSSNGVKSGGQQLWEAIKDAVIRRSDDTDLDTKTTLRDFEGREVQFLPIYYTHMKEGESADDLSTDVVSTMTAYASMANDFNQMNKVVDALEVGRDVLRKRGVKKSSGGKTLKEKFKELGHEVENDLIVYGDASNFMGRLNDYFTMQVYQRYMADEGTTWGMDNAKLANLLNKLSAINMLGLNALSGISNVTTGTVMMRIEAFSKQFFTETNSLHADKYYAGALMEYLGEIGKSVKTSKLALWDEMFNVLQEYETEITDTEFLKGRFAKMNLSSALMVMNHAGEHWMQNRTSLALADAYKMKSPSGEIVSLWDAMEVVPVDKNHPERGAKLQVKQGYTKEDGSEFTREDIIAFSRKAYEINHQMHGIYNKLDASAVQRLAVGKMGLLFRKWIRPSWNKRFSDVAFNYDLDDWTEGYYKTSGRFLKALYDDIRQGQLNIAGSWEQLDDVEKANLRRAMTEVIQFLAVAIFLGVVNWKDKDKDSWVLSMLEYQARRLYTELGVMIPGPQMLNEGLKILDSPSAGINTAQRTLDLFNCFNPYNYEEIAGIEFGGQDAVMKSGKFKGHNRATKYLFMSPFTLVGNTIYRDLHPDESINFFKNN